MATFMPAYQQESANPMFDMERPSFRRPRMICAPEWNRRAKIQESLNKPFEVSMASEFSPVETVNKSIDPSLTIDYSSLVFLAAACAPKTDMLLCCTQNENHDEHQGIDGPIFPKIQILNPYPQNILLDDNMVPKISYFGLPRYYGEENVPNMKSSIGTRGHMLAEYEKGNITSDIFSLGVMILEIVAGVVDKATAAAQNSSNKTMQDAVSMLEEHLLTPYCPRRRTKSLAQTMKLNRKRSISNVKSLKSKVTTSGNGGIDINFGSRTIHVRKSLSIYPRRRHLTRKELVQLWMAEGFIKTTNAEEELDGIGQDYFDELLLASFLQLGERRQGFGYEVDYFTVHDLLRDLAEEAARGDCFRIEKGFTGEVPLDVRHLFVGSCDRKMLAKKIFELQNLRTLIFDDGFSVDDEVLQRIFRSLRKLVQEIIMTGYVDKATGAAEDSSNETMQDPCTELVSAWEEHLPTPYCPRRRTKSLAQTMKLNRKRCISNVKPLKYKVTTSGNGGVDIKFGSCTIHVRKSLSVHHPLIQMVLFANHLHGNEFCCPKSMAPKSITDMVERSPSSASRNAYEAGWVPAEHKRELSQFARAFGTRILVKTVHTSSHNSLPVLFEKSTKKVTISNVSSTQRAGRDIFVVDYKDWMCDAGEMKTWNNTCFASSNTDKAPTGADLRQQLAQNNLAEETNEKPRSNSAPSDTSSDQTERVPKKHKLTDDESQNNSDPNSCIAEGGTNEEAKRSGKWYVATGAAQHATGDCRVITNLQALENNDLRVHAADGTIMPVRGIGSVVTDTVVLPDVYYVPGLWTNLVSVGQLARLDYCIGFSRGACHISDAAGTVVGTAHARGDGLYEVDFLRVPLGITSTGS